jgi:hypothetical protein
VQGLITNLTFDAPAVQGLAWPHGNGLQTLQAVDGSDAAPQLSMAHGLVDQMAGRISGAALGDVLDRRGEFRNAAD